MDRPPEVGERLLPHNVGGGAIPGVGVGADHALGGLGRLAEEEPVPPRGGEAGVDAGEPLGERDRVEHRERDHRVGVVERGPVRDVAAPVMAGDREPVVAQRPHQCDAVARHRALRVRLVVGRGRRLRRFPVAPQVGADHRVAFSQQRRDAMPGDMRARMAVQEHHGRPRPAVADPEHRLPDVDPLEREAFEHAGVLPGQSSWNTPEGWQSGRMHRS